MLRSSQKQPVCARFTSMLISYVTLNQLHKVSFTVFTYNGNNMENSIMSIIIIIANVVEGY